MVQWLELGIFTAEDAGSFPGPGTKIPQAMQKKTPKGLLEKKFSLR